jgi:hypothetical protein
VTPDPAPRVPADEVRRSSAAGEVAAFLDDAVRDVAASSAEWVRIPSISAQDEHAADVESVSAAQVRGRGGRRSVA